MAASSKKGGALSALPEVFDALSERQAKLNVADTRISEVIKQAEAALEGRLTVRVSVDISNESDGGYKTVLTFGKHDGHWHFLVEAETDSQYRPTVKPLLSSSREMRARVVAEGGIEKLIRGACEQLDKLLAVREVALQKASALVEELEDLPPIFGGQPESEDVF